jgi:hypothetical protein
MKKQDIRHNALKDINDAITSIKMQTNTFWLEREYGQTTGVLLAYHRIGALTEKEYERFIIDALTAYADRSREVCA